MSDAIERTIDYVLALTEERDEARAEADRLREALRELAGLSEESVEMIAHEGLALGDTPDER